MATASETKYDLQVTLCVGLAVRECTYAAGWR